VDIGNKLKEARAARGLTLEVVEQETKIRRKYLNAMEEGQFHILPGPIYAKAFLKNYAKFLNLDLEEIMETYDRQFPAETVPEVVPTTPASTSPGHVRKNASGKPRPWLYFAVAVIITGLAFSVYYGVLGAAFRSANKPKGEPAPWTSLQPDGQAQTPAGQPQAPGQILPTRTNGINMVLNVKNAESWIRVDADGSPVFQGIVPAGQSKNFDAREKIYIRLGNAGVVEVLVNGQNLGFLGGPGAVVDREFRSGSQG